MLPLPVIKVEGILFFRRQDYESLYSENGRRGTSSILSNLEDAQADYPDAEITLCEDLSHIKYIDKDV